MAVLKFIICIIIGGSIGMIREEIRKNSMHENSPKRHEHREITDEELLMFMTLDDELRDDKD